MVGLNCVKPLHMTCYQQLKASALMARNLVLIFFVVICPKTLTDELTAVGEKHYQTEIVLLVSALALVWRRCLHVR